MTPISPSKVLYNQICARGVFTLGEIFPIAMGRRPITISEENARVNTQEGLSLKSPLLTPYPRYYSVL